MTRPLPTSVLVTGASGFLGGHVCAALVDRGIAVRGLVRRAGAALPAGVTPAVASDLGDMSSIERALEGVEGVVHLAAHVHRPSSAEDFRAYRRVNVEGTRTVLDRAMAAGVRDFVFISTVKVMGESSEATWTEATPPAPVDPYGITKLEAEHLVRQAAGAQLHAPILRLPLTYGPEMKANALRLFRAVDRGLPLPLGAVRNCRSLLFTGNFVAALLAVLENPRGNDTFFVSDGQDLSTPELIHAIARALRCPARLLPLPTILLRTAGVIGDIVSRVAPLPLTSATVDRVVGSLTVDISKLKTAVGYLPRYSISQGLAITADWYNRQRGP